MIPGRIPGREVWEIEDKLILSNSTDKQGELTIYAGTSGEKALSIYSGTTEIFHILATTTTVRLMGGASTPVQIGDAGSTSQSLAANDDLFVSGKFEVDGSTYFDGYIYFGSSMRVMSNLTTYWGSSAESGLLWSTAQASANTLIWGLGATAKSIIFCPTTNVGKDFDHAAQTNPTIFVHSATDPDTANTQWISISHDTVDGVIACGLGTLNLGGSNVNFVNATRTVATVTHNAYVALEIGGVAYNFMLGA